MWQLTLDLEYGRRLFLITKLRNGTTVSTGTVQPHWKFIAPSYTLHSESTARVLSQDCVLDH